MAWLNRDLQKIILEFMAEKPNQRINPNEITRFLFKQQGGDSSLSPSFDLKEKYHEIANQLNLDKKQNSRTCKHGDTDFIDAFQPSMQMSIIGSKPTTLGKWSNIIHNNMVYLTGHKLLSSLDNTNYQITSKGIDFIQNDGGLSAILNVQTVKFHTDTINDMRSLLETYIQNSDLPEEEKSELSELLSQLGEEAIKTCFTKLLEKGLENIPTLGSFLGVLLFALAK